MKIHTAIRRAAVFLLIAALPLAAKALSPEETVAAAERAEKGGAWERAAEFYTTFLKDNPEHLQRSVVQYRLAVALDNLGRTDAAMEALKEAIASPTDRTDKHRPDAFMRLAKLQADASKYADAAATLDKLFKEGAGLCEDEAQSLRAGYLTILEKYEDAAVMLNVIKNKPSSPYAKDAAWKLAIVWMKSGNDELGKNAIEEFAKQYPGNPKIVELFMRLARSYYEKKNFKSAVELCRQIVNEYKDAPEAMEAAFIVALSYREAGKLDAAAESLEAAAKMPQAIRNAPLACEVLFEAAQIYRKSLNKPVKASELYARAADLARNGDERQKQIEEQSLFFQAEYLLEEKKWGAACDLYAQLRKNGTKLNVFNRILFCQSMMTADGGVAMVAETEEELAFIRKPITEKPGTLDALKAEVYFLDRKMNQMRRINTDRIPWSTLKPLLDEYAALLAKYPEKVLKQQNQDAYIRVRMGAAYSQLGVDVAQRFDKIKAGLALVEQAVSEAPEAPFIVEALETLAFLASSAGQPKKAYDAYKKLYTLSGQDAANMRRQRSEYLESMVAVADSEAVVDDAILTMQAVIGKGPAGSEDVRDARYYLAELLYVRRRYPEAVKAYKDFVKTYGPEQDANGNVLATGKKPGAGGAVLDRVYEAGLRVAHSWRAQGDKAQMIAAYRWVVANQTNQNPRVAEAAYMSIVGDLDLTRLQPAQKENTGRKLWTQVVNASLDFGAKAFQESFYGWVQHPVAEPYVRVALMKAAQLTADGGNHRNAAQMFQQYLKLYDPKNTRVLDRAGNPRWTRDEMYYMASYACGREFMLANDIESMIKAFRDYVDDMRDSKFRAAALQLMGHYGTQAGMYDDAAEAYAALLDEYGAMDGTNNSRQVYTEPKDRLRKKSSWNGFRLPTPDKWDVGQIRFGLGFLYWKKGEWDNCAAALEPFLKDAALRQNPSRAEALFMAGRSQIKKNLVTSAQKTLDQLIADHPDFKGLEDVYKDMVKMCADLSNWDVLDRYYKAYVAKFPTGDKRAYMDLYAAMAQIGKGRVQEGEQALLDLARSETHEDVKAEAYYRLALRKKDKAEALSLLRKSIESYALTPALLEGARCALEVKNEATAREFLDRLLREFPDVDRAMIAEAQELRQKMSGKGTGRP